MFLIGAGCSLSAGVPLAAEVAMRAIIGLAETYGLDGLASKSASQTTRANAALRALVDAERVPAKFFHTDDTPRWGELYSYIFSEHIKHPNEQRALISRLVTTEAFDLNWAHACLGELVKKQYVHTVLTTNFDQLVLKGIIRTGIVPVVADGLESLSRISPTPQWPQVVHLHGSMHTYEIRNSYAALRETEDHLGLQRMMHSILKETTVLVVVGYSGGEEGIMSLLQEAADSLPRMVVYWIAYESDYAGLSQRARDFLERGEYKFFILDQKADDFFNMLLGELGVGPPNWIKNPLEVLTTQAQIKYSDITSDDVAGLIKSYVERIDFAKENGRMIETPLTIANELRSANKFLEASQEIEKLPEYELSDEALRIHATSLYENCNLAPDVPQERLKTAIEEFQTLVSRTGRRVRDDELLAEARRDLYERLPEGAPERRDVASSILKSALTAQARLDPVSRGWSLMEFYQAEANQLLAEQLKHSEPDSAKRDKGRRDLLRKSRHGYANALPGLAAQDAEHARECKEGWAGALSGQAELESKSAVALGYLRQAKSLFEDVVDAARRNTPGAKCAGALENLAGVVEDTAKRFPEEARNARNQERQFLSSALAIYLELDDTKNAQRMQERLDKLPPP
jgi:hypothetical protein